MGDGWKKMINPNMTTILYVDGATQKKFDNKKYLHLIFAVSSN